MKLIATRVKEYKSIWDSNDFEIGDITCLVGKNEAGKTALLEALYKLNPIISTDSEFDVTNDYPRAEVSDYEEDVSEENREPATVVEGTFELQGDDMEAITSLFGKKALKNKKLTLSRKYPDSRGSVTSTRTFSLEANKDESIKYLIQKANIPADLQKKLTEAMDDVAAMLDLIATVEATEDTKRLTKILKVIQEHDVSWYIYNKLLDRKSTRLNSSHIPLSRMPSSA